MPSRISHYDRICDWEVSGSADLMNFGPLPRDSVLRGFTFHATTSDPAQSLPLLMYVGLFTLAPSTFAEFLDSLQQFSPTSRFSISVGQTWNRPLTLFLPYHAVISKEQPICVCAVDGGVGPEIVSGFCAPHVEANGRDGLQ